MQRFTPRPWSLVVASVWTGVCVLLAVQSVRAGAGFFPPFVPAPARYACAVAFGLLALPAWRVFGAVETDDQGFTVRPWFRREFRASWTEVQRVLSRRWRWHFNHVVVETADGRQGRIYLGHLSRDALLEETLFQRAPRSAFSTGFQYEFDVPEHDAWMRVVIRVICLLAAGWLGVLIVKGDVSPAALWRALTTRR
ncbi:MAG: hypothetical protein HY719_05535 [Planctomycetes bacterium]|nr:hypothetical protein [Planctomycetota bacterium]